MKTSMLVSVMIASFILLAGGCGEGPVFPEGSLSDASAPPEKPPVEDSGVTPSESSWDPDQQRRIEEQQNQEEQQQEQEEESEEAIKDSADAIDKISFLLNDKNFDEAKKVFDDNQQLIQRTADDGMAHENPEIGKLYKQWWDALVEMRQMLDREDLEPEKKSRDAIDAIVAAGRFKQAAKQAGIFER